MLTFPLRYQLKIIFSLLVVIAGLFSRSYAQCNPAIPPNAIVIKATTTNSQGGLTFWVCSGDTLTANGLNDTIYAESGASVSSSGINEVIYLAAGAKVLIANGPTPKIYYVNAADLKIVSGTAIKTQCTSITYDYTNAPANGCVSCAGTSPLGLSLFPSASVCLGKTSTITQVGGTLSTGSEWRWYTDSCGGAFVDTGDAITVSPTVTTTYYVRAEGGACGMSSCLSATLTLVTPVTPIITGQLSLCGGQPDTLRFSNNPCPGGGCGYLWSTGISALSLIVSPSVTTTYSVQDINTCGDTTSASFAVTVYPNQPTVVQNGDTLTSSDLTGISYQWFLNGTLIPGATSSSYVASQAGYYTVVIFDASGCKAPSDSVYVTNVGLESIPSGGFELFPNPTTGNMIILFNDIANNATVRIYNMLGEEVCNAIVNGKRATVSLNVPPGIYLIKIEEEGKTYNYGKMIKE